MAPSAPAWASLLGLTWYCWLSLSCSTAASVAGASHGAISYFENTGTSASPVFTERTGAQNPFNGITGNGYSSPSFADLDGDGDLDLAFGSYNALEEYVMLSGDKSFDALTLVILGWDAQTRARDNFCTRQYSD